MSLSEIIFPYLKVRVPKDRQIATVTELDGTI